MKKIVVVAISLYVGLSATAGDMAARLRNRLPAAVRQTTPATAKLTVDHVYGKLPLGFERNDGQTDAQVKFISRGDGYTLFLTPAEAVLALHEARRQVSAASRAPAKTSVTSHANGAGETGEAAALRVRLLGANPNPQITGEGDLAGTANYFIGKDPKQWRSNVPTYAKVRYRNVYPGIDLVYYGTLHRQLEYDFVLAPGADPNAIALRFDGASQMGLNRDGDLIVTVADGGTLIHHAPVIYQERGGRREAVDGRCVFRSSNSVGFELASYDRARPVYIDPGLVYSTYLGGSDSDQGQAIAVDAFGNAYVTGITDSLDFPTTAGAFVTTPPGGGNMFVTKIAADGSGSVYSTYLGGNQFDNFESGYGIAVDATGSAYVTGQSGAGTFPTTPGAFQTTYGGGYTDAFVAKLTPDGSGLVYSTYLGGGDTDEALGIAIDASGAAYVTGHTSSTNVVCKGIALPLACCTGFHAGTCSFPTTAGAFQTANNAAATAGANAFVTKLKPDGSGLLYSTYLGGSHGDGATGIAVDATGHAYVTGSSTSGDFPTTPGAFQTTKPSEFSIWDTPFVTKLKADGSGLIYSTYVGGSQPDDVAAIAVDASGDAYVTGTATSTDFPTTAGAFQTTNHSVDYYNIFVAKMNVDGTGLIYSTYLGGTDGEEQGFAVAVGDSGHAYVTGRTNSGDFPTTADALQSSLRSAGWNAFVTKLRADGSGLVYSTYMGGTGANPGDYGFGIAVDAEGSAYVTGLTDSGDFPTTSGAAQTTEAGGSDAFVTKLSVPIGSDPTTTTTISSTTLVPTTTISGASTTTTTLACASARCTLAALPRNPACAGQSIPASVTGKVAHATSLIDQSASSSGKQARKLLKRATKALKQAAAKATRAAKGKHPKLSPACAAALHGGLAGVVAGLGV
jgi:hypothetical protein